MPRSVEHYLSDILIAIGRIQKYTQNIDKDQFKADDLRVDGVLHNLTTVGEAVKNVPDDIRNKAPEIRWRDIGRFRDRVVHHYFSLDLDIVWEIITVHLPPLNDYVSSLKSELSEGGKSDENDTE